MNDGSGGAADARSGGGILADQLRIHGVDMAFCVPGESYLELLDALHDHHGIALINARHEAGAANMADAYGKLTGRPGLCLVTRGPGACHGAVGIHTAAQDSTPLIMLIGQVGRDALDREAFQEIDYRRMFGSIAKWAAQIERADRIPEYIARAFQVATSGRPGPVVLALPEDMLTDRVVVGDAKPYAAVAPHPTRADLDRLMALLAKAERPLIIAGGAPWSEAASAALAAFAEANRLPVAVSFRRQDAMAGASASYAGDLGTSGPPPLVKRVKDADLLIAVGARLGEMTTQGYSVMSSPEPSQTLVHVHADPDELGRVFRPTLAINAAPTPFALALGATAPIAAPRWSAWTQAARADYLASLEPQPYNGALDMGRAMRALQGELPRDAIITVDAGNFSGWPQRYLQYAKPMRQLGPTSGAMGYSVPAAVAAALLHRDRLVVGCVGDGGFMMSGQEIATAVQHGASPIIMVFNNRMYGTIRMHQEREHPARVVGTQLVNPDFAALGRAMGCHGETVRATDEFIPAFRRAVASKRAAVIELRTDPELVSTRLTLTAIREAALARARTP
jgi:acetolactate synthase-1/2/3 large subunit